MRKNILGLFRLLTDTPFVDKLAFVLKRDTPAPPVRSSRLVPALLGLTAFLAACGPRPPVGETQARKTGARALEPGFDVAVTDHVELAFQLTNGGSRTVEISFPSGLTHDFVVLDTLDREVWRWSQGRLFTQSMQNHILDANEALRYQASWNPGDRHGTYVAVVSLNSLNHPVEQRTRFVVP